MARILLVQQEGDECLELLRLLTAAGHVVEAASSSHTASRLFESNPADVVIADLNLPNQQALGLIQGLRYDHGDVNVIVLCPAEEQPSGPGASPWIKMSTAVGARRALTRPLDRGSLLDAVDALARSAGAGGAGESSQAVRSYSYSRD